MAKIMAVVENGVVTNTISCSDDQSESETWLDISEYPVTIGDTYSDGKWYRDGVEILTPLELAQQEITNLQSQISEMDAAYREGVNSI